MFKRFLKELLSKAEARGFSKEEVAEIKATYKSRFELGREAGLSENDIVARFGTVDDIIKVYEERHIQKNYAKVKANSIVIDSSINGIITFTYGQGDKMYYALTDETYFDVTTTGDSLTIKSKFDIKKRTANIIVYIPYNLTLKTLNINAPSAKVDFDGVRLQAEEARLRTLSGSYSIKSLIAKDCRLETVSGNILVGELLADTLHISSITGDVEVKNINVEKASFSSLSGNMSLTGHVGTPKVTTLSGEVTVNTVKVGKSISQTLLGIFGIKPSTNTNNEE